MILQRAADLADDLASGLFQTSRNIHADAGGDNWESMSDLGRNLRRDGDYVFHLAKAIKHASEPGVTNSKDLLLWGLEESRLLARDLEQDLRRSRALHQVTSSSVQRLANSAATLCALIAVATSDYTAPQRVERSPEAVLTRRVEALIRCIRLYVVENQALSDWIQNLQAELVVLRGQRDSLTQQLRNSLDDATSLRQYTREIGSYCDALEAMLEQRGWDRGRLEPIVVATERANSAMRDIIVAGVGSLVGGLGVLGVSNVSIAAAPEPVVEIHQQIHAHTSHVLSAIEDALLTAE